MTSATEPKNILLKGDGIASEAVSAGAITAGHLLELTSAGEVQVQSSAAATTPLPAKVARLMDLTNKSIDDPYAAGDTVLYYDLQKGAEFYGLLADGANVAIGDPLETDGAGGFQAVTSGTPIVQAVEAVNNTSGAQARIRVKVI